MLIKRRTSRRSNCYRSKARMMHRPSYFLLQTSRYDLMHSWSKIITKLDFTDTQTLQDDFSIFLEDWPQLKYKFQSKEYIMAVEPSKYLSYDVLHCLTFTHTVIEWRFKNNGREIHTEKFTFPCRLTNLIYIHDRRIYVAIDQGAHLIMLMYNKTKDKIEIVSNIDEAFNATCLAYVKDISHVVVGGIGFLKCYPMLMGKEMSTKIGKMKVIKTTLREKEFTRCIFVDQINKRMHLLTDQSIIMVDYMTLTEERRFQDPNEPFGCIITCCCLYRKNEYFITGNSRGTIRIWNPQLLTEIHTYKGHRTKIAGVKTCWAKALLFSASDDGWVYIWRLDAFKEPLQRTKVGEKLISFGLTIETNTPGFWCFTGEAVVVYEYNMFSIHFASMDSSVYKIQRVHGLGQHPNRILVATEDGGLRHLNPVTGNLIGYMFPMTSLYLMQQFAYNALRKHAYVVMGEGSVMVLDCSKSPYRGLEIVQPSTSEDAVTCIKEGVVSLGEDLEDVIVLAGFKYGQIQIIASDIFTMNRPVQAHHSPVEFLDMMTNVNPAGTEVYRSSRAVVSAGNDYGIKVWKLVCIPLPNEGMELSLQFVTQIRCHTCPRFLVASLDRVAVVYWEKNVLHMFDLSCDPKNPVLHSHTRDYDHTLTVTALQTCPLFRIYATSSLDCTVKIWDDHNELLRELIFTSPVSYCCFSSDVGDLLTATHSIIRLASADKYLPWSYLLDLKDIPFQTLEERELEMEYQVSMKSWIDPFQIHKRVLASRPVSTSMKAQSHLEGWELYWRSLTGRQFCITVPIPAVATQRIRQEEEKTRRTKRTLSHAQQRLSIVFPCAPSLVTIMREELMCYRTYGSLALQDSSHALMRPIRCRQQRVSVVFPPEPSLALMGEEAADIRTPPKGTTIGASTMDSSAVPDVRASPGIKISAIDVSGLKRRETKTEFGMMGEPYDIMTTNTFFFKRPKASRLPVSDATSETRQKKVGGTTTATTTKDLEINDSSSVDEVFLENLSEEAKKMLEGLGIISTLPKAFKILRATSITSGTHSSEELDEQAELESAGEEDLDLGRKESETVVQYMRRRGFSIFSPSLDAERSKILEDLNDELEKVEENPDLEPHLKQFLIRFGENFRQKILVNGNYADPDDLADECFREAFKNSMWLALPSADTEDKIRCFHKPPKPKEEYADLESTDSAFIYTAEPDLSILGMLQAKVKKALVAEPNSDDAKWLKSLTKEEYQGFVAPQGILPVKSKVQKQDGKRHKMDALELRMPSRRSPLSTPPSTPWMLPKKRAEVAADERMSRPVTLRREMDEMALLVRRQPWFPPDVVLEYRATIEAWLSMLSENVDPEKLRTAFIFTARVIGSRELQTEVREALLERMQKLLSLLGDDKAMSLLSEAANIADPDVLRRVADDFFSHPDSGIRLQMRTFHKISKISKSDRQKQATIISKERRVKSAEDLRNVCQTTKKQLDLPRPPADKTPKKPRKEKKTPEGHRFQKRIINVTETQEAKEVKEPTSDKPLQPRRSEIPETHLKKVRNLPSPSKGPSKSEGSSDTDISTQTKLKAARQRKSKRFIFLDMVLDSKKTRTELSEQGSRQGPRPPLKARRPFMPFLDLGRDARKSDVDDLVKKKAQHDVDRRFYVSGHRFASLLKALNVIASTQKSIPIGKKVHAIIQTIAKRNLLLQKAPSQDSDASLRRFLKPLSMPSTPVPSLASIEETNLEEWSDEERDFPVFHSPEIDIQAKQYKDFYIRGGASKLYDPLRLPQTDADEEMGKLHKTEEPTDSLYQRRDQRFRKAVRKTQLYTKLVTVKPLGEFVQPPGIVFGQRLFETKSKSIPGEDSTKTQYRCKGTTAKGMTESTEEEPLTPLSSQFDWSPIPDHQRSRAGKIRPLGTYRGEYMIWKQFMPSNMKYLAAFGGFMNAMSHNRKEDLPQLLEEHQTSTTPTEDRKDDATTSFQKTKHERPKATTSYQKEYQKRASYETELHETQPAETSDEEELQKADDTTASDKYKRQDSITVIPREKDLLKEAADVKPIEKELQLEKIAVKPSEKKLQQEATAVKPSEKAWIQEADAKPSEKELRLETATAKSSEKKLRQEAVAVKTSEKAWRQDSDTDKPSQKAWRQDADTVKPSQKAWRRDSDTVKPSEKAWRQDSDTVKPSEKVWRQDSDTVKPSQKAWRQDSDTVKPSQKAWRQDSDTVKPSEKAWRQDSDDAKAREDEEQEDTDKSGPRQWEKPLPKILWSEDTLKSYQLKSTQHTSRTEKAAGQYLEKLQQPFVPARVTKVQFMLPEATTEKAESQEPSITELRRLLTASRWIPGEAGLRVARGVTVRPRVQPPDPQRPDPIKPLEGRMGMMTVDRHSGESLYGRVGLLWTSKVPCVPLSPQEGMSEMRLQIPPTHEEIVRKTSKRLSQHLRSCVRRESDPDVPSDAVNDVSSPSTLREDAVPFPKLVPTPPQQPVRKEKAAVQPALRNSSFSLLPPSVQEYVLERLRCA